MGEYFNIFIITTVAWLACAVDKGFSYGAPLENKFPLGTVGCLFTNHLCGLDEECIDDLLFGNCQAVDEIKDYFQYQLSRKALESLEGNILHLIKGGYSWRDTYTQCVLQNTLLAYRQHKKFHYSRCLDLENSDGSWSENVNKDIATVLENIFKEYYNSYNPSVDGSSVDISNSNKRDEIIHVHKYFDESMRPHDKRYYESSRSLLDQNYLNYLPDSYNSYLEKRNPEDINLQDIQSLQYFLKNLRDSQERDFIQDRDLDLGYNIPYNLPLVDSELDSQTSGNSDLVPSKDVWVRLGSDSEKDTGNQIIWNEGEMPGNSNDQKDDEDDVFYSLSPEFANLLGKLLQGEVQANSLTNEELSYLTKYVNSRLKQLGYTPEEISLIGGDRPLEQESTVLENDKEATKYSTDSEPEENKNDNSYTNPSGAENESEEIFESNMGSPPETDKKNMGFPVVGEVFDPEAKKNYAVDSGLDDTNDIINTDYAFVQVKENIDKEQANELVELVENLYGPEQRVAATDVILVHTPSGGSKVTFRVIPHNGINASEVVEKAKENKDALSKAAHLTIERTGIGNSETNEVELSDSDDRYFVLTFVLCGCIAGVLLAVVVIYLIRRHSRSKEKLARLATTGEGTEASKDYQDLCRQRMQSKSSEKPEPLHAASRIGSVSETQVRSPSSRSSTSSWSEEPVTNNMDISTGHIVLSYMEDHLKNKDRLDREWENLCSYEADPSSTKIANDTANMRKNRYSDILPYDHSRVILSNTNNVSGSDFINASSITDHDPRNPAYIATQGPLPYTIADFWQMIWEQGSVVIVMLSKLTENGEAMCHRYWPEEGSDLYHTYEVNLVSEHVWCDDYLVRSFYLKNVQTGETRTVTQFHFLTWPDLGIPSSIKALLDFRRKVNKSYRGRSCPIVVHCSDGCGRTGTYCLIDMVLNRMSKGAKEIDIAATLEHIRDQRMNMVKTKEQFQFVLGAVAEEVHAILKALPQ